MAALRELLVTFGFKADSKPLEKVDKQVEKSKDNLKKLDTQVEKTSGVFGSFLGFLAGAAAIGAFKNLLETQIAYYGHLSDLTDKLGVSSEELQKFAYAAKLSGVELDSAALALQFLNKNLSTKGAASVFAGLKVQTKEANGQLRPTAAILGDVGEAINKLPDAAKQTAAAMALFGRSGASLLPFFKQGKQGIQGLYDKFDDLGLLVDGEVVTQIDDLGDSIDEVKTQFLSLGTDLLIGIMPYLKQLVSWVSKTVKHFKKFNQESGFLNGALKVLGAVGIGLAVFKFIKLADSLALAGKEASTLRNVFALGTWGLVLAAVVALGLAFQDLWTYLEGGDSLFGRFLEKTLGLKESNNIAQQFRSIWKEIGQSFDDLWKTVKDIVPAFKDIFTEDKPAWLEALKFTVAIMQVVLEDINTVLKFSKDFIGAIDFSIGKIGEALKPADLPGLPQHSYYTGAPQIGTISPAQGAPLQSSVSQTNQTTINVSGSSSPKEVAKEVSSRLNEVNSSSLQDAYYSVAR